MTRLGSHHLTTKSKGKLSVMKHTFKCIPPCLLPILIMSVALLRFPCHAQTIVSGNISGTWTKSGNPYIIPDAAAVPGGSKLTLEAGVQVWIGEGVSIQVSGTIEALGVENQRITFQSPAGSQFWNEILVSNDKTNIFNYCDFLNATNALVLTGWGSNEVKNCTFRNVRQNALSLRMPTRNKVVFSSFQNVGTGIFLLTESYGLTDIVLQAYIRNCSFSACSERAIFGKALAADYPIFSTGRILCSVLNCTFADVGDGCVFDLVGSGRFGTSANVTIGGNSFARVADKAIELTASLPVANSPAFVINNTFVNANQGLAVQDPWDAKAQNNIFVGCTNAVGVSGTLSRAVSYNDFTKNLTNFVGYPNTYGTVIMANRNGTPCDLLYNIFEDPKFVSQSDFTLQVDSSCIDAGTSDPAYLDVSFPPSQATGLPDLGMYGGPFAANWLPVIPERPAPMTLSAVRAIKVGAEFLERGTYQVQSALHMTNWSNYGAPFYVTNVSSFIRYMDATNHAENFRLQKLP